MFVNAHDHLPFGQNVEEYLEQIQEQKICTLACSMDTKEYKIIKKIAEKNPYIKKGLGIHPWRVEKDTRLEQLESDLIDCDFIGEIGLDYFWDKRTDIYPKQREVFESFLLLAKKYNKITNIHTKGAEADVLFFLKKYNLRQQIIHWYSGPLDLIDSYLQLDSYFTIGCDIGYSKTTDELIKRIPLDRILTETDGPSALEWVNGQYGHPVFVKEIILYLSTIKNLDPSVIKKEIYKNYQRLHFSLD